MDCVIVGNGESLNYTPLKELAKRYDTFGCNRIHLLPFQPTYYVRVEPPQMEGSSEAFFDECRLHIANREQCIFPSEWRTTLGNALNVIYVNTCHHYKYSHEHKKFPAEWHLPFLCDTNAVTAMMQVAVLKGYTRLYLVGCDLEGKHFSANDNGAVDAERLRVVHEIANRSCPVPVYNATPGGKLEVYPRVPMENLL